MERFMSWIHLLDPPECINMLDYLMVVNFQHQKKQVGGEYENRYGHYNVYFMRMYSINWVDWNIFYFNYDM